MCEEGGSRAVYNIGAVERRTGIKADLVRAWERRYGAVVPTRTATDRRLYSDADIGRLTLLRDATRLGHRISHIASLTDAELKALLRPPSVGAERVEPAESRPNLENRLFACMAAIEALDALRLRTELERASFDLGRLSLIEDLFVPLMERVGARWLHGEMDPAEEHLATAVMRELIGVEVGRPAEPGAPVVVITTPEGQSHEIGVLLASAVAVSEGWRVVYLGTSLPSKSIVRAAQRSGAAAVALGITYPEAMPNVVDEVRAVAGALEGIKLIVGGRGVSALESLADAGDVSLTRGLADFRSILSSFAHRPTSDST